MSQLRTSDVYRRTVARHAGIAVAENAMKWSALRPDAEHYTFEAADEVLNFTESHGIKLRGHNLCWHEQIPAWFGKIATTITARNLLLEHIRTVAGRYAGRIHSWDVVNEAIQVKDGRADGMRTSPWLKLLGPDYVEIAFRAAREADPAALLTYNEFGIEAEGPEDEAKRAAVLLLLRRLKQRNVPIDAVGIQSHIRAGGVYGPSLRRFIRNCGELDLQVFVTEMDVDDRELPREIRERDRDVAGIYRTYLDLVLAEPCVRAVLVWGVDDSHSWLNSKDPRKDGMPQRPLLFDSDFHAKASFGAVADSLAGTR